ncbi:MAG: sigma 54-interacting transcriptional regulator, partial [Myxococcales bacterium]|nr:sigma 54-interacting transcriptional regulator [Myxococcales bacterium]
GHVRGAFTGAAGAREGALKSADGGVLFLDEIGELGLDEQAMLLRALEDRRFLPLGSDREVESDFQLIAGTNRELRERIREGRFREDLLARIDVWHFELPGLRERPEDIGPNLEYELDRWTQKTGSRVTMTREARARFLAFATSPAATWAGNFRDFAAAIERMTTLASAGRIGVDLVDEEIVRLRRAWGALAGPPAPRPVASAPTKENMSKETHEAASVADADLLARFLDADALAALDRFDRPQLAEALRACLAAPSLSAAGRELFAASRARRRSVNDADRLRKYLARFGLSWQALRGEG